MGFSSKLLLLTKLLLATTFLIRLADAQITNPWANPALLPLDEDREEIEWIFNDVEGTVINMHESIAGDVVLGRLNYDGSGSPFVGPFTAGIRAQLGPVIRRDATIDPSNPNAWYLVTTEMQDYEAGHRQYMFTVVIEEGTTVYSHRVSIVIVNIDDNAPTIFPVACSVPENEVGLTTCVYRVHDLDGWMSIAAMTIHILGTNNEDEIFDFDLERDRATSEFDMYITLRTLAALDFILMALHSFPIRARDTMQYSAEVVIMVQVVNVESRPPRWVQIFAVEQFKEKTYQSFTVQAIDGDTGINADIFYELKFVDGMPFFSIDHTTGVLSVTPIDRDYLQIEIFQFQIVAYKNGVIQPRWETPFNVVIIVEDVNDNKPEPFHNDYTIDIPEETFMTIDFIEFGFNDIDAGLNAQYDVELVSISPEGASDAFTVAPTQGYQDQTFFLTINDAPRLDYEDIPWQEIHMVFRATERMNPEEHIGNAAVTIRLVNWNDEQPIFESEAYTASFRENVGVGYDVITVKANDRDIDDEVVYNLLGNANNFFNIDEKTGDITVSQDDAFNYQRQNQIVVQITATDTLGDGNHHTVTTQLTIQLIDVNNTPPDIRMPRQTPNVEENVEEGLITDQVIGSDVDTSAIIVFEIDWSSTYATKQGRMTSPEHYLNCVRVETVYTTPGETGQANAHIYVTGSPIIDFEEFDVLYLTLRVNDIMTEYFEPYRESTLTIAIIDRNDNKPEFLVEPADLDLVVREVSNEGVIIGSLQANDIDGPMYNQVGYTLIPRDGTPDGLVRIHPSTGQITVDTHQAIDADEPRYKLYYTVIADDICKQEGTCGPDEPLETRRDLEIQIIDTNNREPELLPFNNVVSIYENATTGDYIGTILATDRDRDVPYHTIHYSINFGEHPNLRNFFAVDENTGVVYVNYESDLILDRDGGPDTHIIFLSLVDNIIQEGDRNMNRVPTNLTVILLDVNDNAPVLPTPQLPFWTISEGLEAEVEIGYVHATDADEPGSDNSRVSYLINSITIENRDITIPQNLFRIETRQSESGWDWTGHLITTQPLRGFWGTYNLEIKAFDHGIPSLPSDETYQLIIEPYNYHHPEFIFPTDGYIIRLSREHALQTGTLLRLNGDILEPITATDEDGLHAGSVFFTIEDNDLAYEIFSIVRLQDNTADFSIPPGLTELEQSYQFTLTATDQGTVPGPLSTSIRVTVTFVATTGFPVFQNNEEVITFAEGEAGLSESVILREAEDPRNFDCFGDDCIPIFYFIVGGVNANFFNLESTTNRLTLSQPLDHEAASQHVITVAATVVNTRPDSPNFQSLLYVTVNVLETNPVPRFERSLYTAGISVGDLVGRQLITFYATHSLNEHITYAIDIESMVADSTLIAVQNTAFNLNPVTGVLLLNFQVLASMNGMFEFDVTATDEQGAVSTTEVKIFLITELNRISFSFLNTLSEVDTETAFIAQVFTDAFGMICNVDSVTQGANEQGVAQGNLTDVRVHFIQDDVAVPATEIEIRRSDAALLRSLRETLSTRNLHLGDLLTSGITGQLSDFDEILRITLIVVSCVLALLCVLLLVGYCYRTRSLMRRLDALSTTKFGSNESGLNRIGVPVPNTNQHAIQGSNPVWNEKLKSPDFDSVSNVSGDSELIGIEDNPYFKSDFFPPEGETFTSISRGNSGDQNSNRNGFQYPEASTSTSNGKVNPLFEKY